MERRNGKLVLNAPFIIDATVMDKASTYTDDQTLTLDQSGHLLIMNAGTDKTFTLPSVGSSDIGKKFHFASIGAGKITIAAADADTIDDSTATTGDISATTASNVIVTLSIKLVSATEWAILPGANGAWTTS